MDNPGDPQEELALFRHGLVAPLLRRQLARGEQAQVLRELAAQPRRSINRGFRKRRSKRPGKSFVCILHRIVGSNGHDWPYCSRNTPASAVWRLAS